MTASLTLASAFVASGNSCAVSISTSGIPVGDVLTFGFQCPVGFSVPWSGGVLGGILGITLACAATVAPGTYTIPYVWDDLTANTSGSGTFSVTVIPGRGYSLSSPNQIQRALGRLTSAFRNQPNVRAILSSLLVGTPELENLFWQIINGRNLTILGAMVASGQATGTQLDIIGGLVGEPRQGRSDAQYLPAIQVRIRVNRSKGTAEDIIQVSNLLAPGSTYSEFPYDKFLVTLWNPSISPVVIASLLAETKAVGTRGIVHYSTWPSANNLRFSSRYGGTTSATVLGSRYGAVASAGLLVSAIEATPTT